MNVAYLHADTPQHESEAARMMISSSIFIRDHYAKEGVENRDQLFSCFDLDSDAAADHIPIARTFTCHLQTRIDPTHAEECYSR